MALRSIKNTAQVSGRRPLPISATILALAFTVSVVQYIQKGEVNWVTDSFRKAEVTAKKLIGSENTGRLADGIVKSITDFSSGINGNVVGVTEGDTIKVLDADRVMYKVRLAGIDAPEKGQPFGHASTKHLTSMLAGKDVFVESSRKDEHGRVLGKVWVQPSDCLRCGKTLNANHAQILAGMAWWYRYYAEEQSPEDRGRYESAEDEAKARKWGLWADPNPINPYEWRRSHR